MHQWPDCSIAYSLVMVLMLAGCEIQAPRPMTAASEAIAPAVYQPTTLGGQLLLAEALLQDPDGDISQAITLYLQAAEATSDPAVAVRATALARQFGTIEETLAALTLWLQREPNSRQAQEARLIVAIEQAAYDDALERLGILIDNNINYKVQWLSGLLRGDEQIVKTVWIPALTSLATNRDNTSLAMVVTELQQNSGLDGKGWLDRWLATHRAYDDLILYRARMELPDRPAAIAIVEQVPEVSRSTDVRAQLARWIGLEGRDHEALVLLQGVVDDDPKRERDRLTLALLLAQKERSDEAEGHLKALLVSADLRATAYYHLGDLARLAGDRSRAIDRFLRVDQGELIVDARKQLAALAVENGAPEQALRWFEEARLLYPHLAAPLYVAEARFLAGQDDTAAVIQSLSEAIRRHPDDPDLRYSRALAFAELDRIAEAEADLRAILIANPESVDALNALGYTLADQTDRYDEAFELISKALAGAPESPAILDSMGWVLLKLGRIEESLSYFEKAWSQVQDHEIAAHYGEALWHLGRQADAWEIWNQGFASEPESAIITNTIDRLTTP